MKKVLKIDMNGFYIEDVILNDNETMPSNCVETVCPEGFYKPKWDGSTWVEGLSVEEIATIPASIDADAELYSAIEAATTIAGLKAALLGQSTTHKSKVKAKFLNL